MPQSEPEPIELVAELQAAVLGTTVARAHPPAVEWAALIADVRDMRARIKELEGALEIARDALSVAAEAFPAFHRLVDAAEWDLSAALGGDTDGE
jgi:hypothetical protein